MRHLIVLLFLTVVQAGSAQADPIWPEMREFELSFGVKLNYHRNDIDIPLYDVDGDIRYRLICKGDDREEDESTLSKEGRAQQNPYTTWWPMTCILTTGTGPEQGEYTEETLLAEPPYGSGVHATRGHIGRNELIGACGDYPEYGRVRHFRLRGFELTFEFTDVVVEPDTPAPTPARPFVSPVEYTVMHISLRRDSTAQTAESAPSDYLHPRGECELVKKGIERRDCRDTGIRAMFVLKCVPGDEYAPGSMEDRPYAVGSRKPKPVDEKRLEASWSERVRTRKEEGVKLIRQAARARDGAVLSPILPEPPFMLLCGKAGTPEWKGLRVDDMADWNRLWLAMLSQNSFNGIEDLSMDEVQLSSKNGIWIRGETFRFQDGLTVATDLSCSMLERTLD